VIDIFCKAVIDGLHINKFIETGTFAGETIAQVSLWFAELHPEFGQIEKLVITGAKGSNPWNTYITYPVFKATSRESNFKIYSVDSNSELYQTAKEIFSSNSNIILACQSSEQFLKELVDSESIDKEDNCFFYLDAHWGKYWPLHDEIRQVLRLKRFAIVIDDFAVPGYPEFGYDVYGYDACDWNYIKNLFRKRQVLIYYPMRANQDGRGWVLIISGYPQESLAFLDKVPLFASNFRGIFVKKTKIWLWNLVLRNRILHRGAKAILSTAARFKRGFS